MKRLLLFLFTAFAFWAHMAFAGGPELSPNPWMVYVGGYGGFYSADYLYSSRYYSTRLNGYVAHTNDAFQEGDILGAQIGVQYHFRSPYFLGMVFNYTLNSNKAYLTKFVDDSAALGILFDKDHTFRVDYNLDMALVFGIDLTPQTHVYTKLGASYARFMHTLGVFVSSSVPLPSQFAYRSESKYLWGWTFGLGLAHDISKWINIFAEYDHYGFARRNLDVYVTIGPASFAGFDRLTQKTRTTANAYKLGLNVKFMGEFSRALYGMSASSRWMGYLGIFGAYSAFNVSYNGTYFSNQPGGSVILNNNSFQQAYSFGGQLGAQYHFRSPYFLGAVFSAMTNNGKAYLVQNVDSFGAPGFIGFDIIRSSRVDYNLDLAMLLGADVTPQMHVYMKIGASYAGLAQQLNTTLARSSTIPVVGFQASEHKGLWGWVAGLGTTYDLNKWVNVFAEYVHYIYPDVSLQTLNSVSPYIGGPQRDTLNQRLGLTANSIRVGLNVKFGDSYSAMKYLASLNRLWQIYFGAFAGYYNVDFSYAANISSNAQDNRSFGNDAFQQGYSVGGQLGAQYHFRRSPYFLGLVFSAMYNGHKARLVEFNNTLTSINNQAINFDYELHINSNYDLAFALGADITQKAHLYAKLGASCGNYKQLISVIQGNNNVVPTPFISQQQSLTKTLWGWLAALGLTYEFSKRVNIFAEYDHYNYYTTALDRAVNFAPNIFAGQANLLTQHVSSTANSIRVGLNLKFEV